MKDILIADSKAAYTEPEIELVSLGADVITSSGAAKAFDGQNHDLESLYGW